MEIPLGVLNDKPNDFLLRFTFAGQFLIDQSTFGNLCYLPRGSMRSRRGTGALRRLCTKHQVDPMLAYHLALSVDCIDTLIACHHTAS